jgi:alkanesulfonate monooxygenase SsuD/methylene tetrahydromethanopterin reductase-like flavin-dependent oxidoreductase (luciferase family)
VRVGVVILPQLRWPEARATWVRAEELGFAHAWTYDHLAWRTLRDEPWFASVPLLAAVATVTERIRFGPLVASPNFRHPVPFAKEVVALDDLSNGRLTLGIGAGGTGWDATMLGRAPWSPRERAERFEEFVELLDVALRTPKTSWTGEHYAAEEARTLPGCVQQPRVPFAIAATGPRGMRLAAQFGQLWVTTGDRRSDGTLDAAAGARVVATQMARLDDACDAVGRPRHDVARMVLTGGELDSGLASAAAFDEVCGRYEEVGVTDLVVPWPRADQPYAADPEVFEQIFSR